MAAYPRRGDDFDLKCARRPNFKTSPAASSLRQTQFMMTDWSCCKSPVCRTFLRQSYQGQKTNRFADNEQTQRLWPAKNPE